MVLHAHLYYTTQQAHAYTTWPGYYLDNSQAMVCTIV